MKSLIFAALLSIPAFGATTTFDISCTTPGLHYLNSFSFEGSIEATETETGWKIYSTRPSMTVRRAGFETETEEVTLPSMKGDIKKIDNRNLTKRPFYNVKLTAFDKSAFVNLNLNYPNPLSSFIRLANGHTFKATCKLQNSKTCLLKDTLYGILGSDKYETEELGVVEKYLESFETVVPTQKVKITIKSKGIVLYAFYTFQDEVDGGNTYGVIERENGDVAATIADSDIYDCNVY